MTPERIAELRALADAASPGPWMWKGWNGCDESQMSLRDFQNGDVIWAYGLHTEGFIDATDADRSFIATARTALPEALDMLERMRAYVGLHRAKPCCDHCSMCTDEISDILDGMIT